MGFNGVPFQRCLLISGVEMPQMALNGGQAGIYVSVHEGPDDIQVAGQVTGGAALLVVCLDLHEPGAHGKSLLNGNEFPVSADGGERGVELAVQPDPLHKILLVGGTLAFGGHSHQILKIPVAAV